MVSPLGRVVEINEEGRHLSKERGFLVVQCGREEVGRVPLDDLMAVMATARGTSVSVALLSALADRGVPFIVPGANFAPAGLLWPVEGWGCPVSVDGLLAIGLRVGHGGLHVGFVGHG